MVNDITPYKERIQELNVQLSGSQNGREAREPIAEIFLRMLEMLDTCDYSYQTENIYVRAINDLNAYAKLFSEENEEMKDYLEEAKALNVSLNEYISKFPPSTDQTLIRMATSDENDEILVDDSGEKLELEFSAILFDEEA